MNSTLGTHRRRRLVRALGAGVPVVAVGLLAGRAAQAQTIMTDNTAVVRYGADSDASIPNRPPDENPNGISYSDCAADEDMQFTLDFSTAPPAGTELQVWVGEGDCISQAASRQPGTSPYGRCWQAAPVSAFPLTGATTSTGRLHMRDIVAYVGNTDPPVTYSDQTSASVCQPTNTTGVVTLNIFFMFIPISGSGTADGGSTTAPAYVGTPAEYALTAALIGPFAPLEVVIPEGGISDGTLSVSWEPQAEPTIQGYNIYYEDLTVAVGAAEAGSTLVTPIYCRQKLPCMASDSGKADAKPADAACDAGESDAYSLVTDAASLANASDAALTAMGCYREATHTVFDATSSSGGGTTCMAAALVNTFTVDGGLGSSVSTTSTPEPTTTGSDSGFDSDLFDSGTSVETSSTVVVNPTTTTNQETAGISNIPAHYRYAFVSGASTSSFTLTGLTDGHQYAIGVAAVDGSGNVGPIGDLACAAPEPVTDFFSAYTQAGGQAGGGFCTIVGAGAPAFGSLFGVGVAGAVVAFARRRQRRTR